MWTPVLSPLPLSIYPCHFFYLHLTVYDLVQVTKDYRLARVSGPLTYNDISASPEGRRDIWTDRERDWEEAEALDTGQEEASRAILDGHWLCQGKGAGHGAGQG